MITEAEYDILAGLHAEIPACCVAEYVSFTRNELTLIQSNLAKAYTFPHTFKLAEYVPCWDCLTRKNIVQIHFCNRRRVTCRVLARIYREVYGRSFSFSR